MRRIFLIRHGAPDLPAGSRICLGRTDPPLGPVGRMQAVLLGESLSGVPFSAVFSSPLLRCMETADSLQLPVSPAGDLAEQNMGVWDGLSFDEVRRTWPELYEQRAEDPLLVPPGAERLADVQKRAADALDRCIAGSAGDIAVFAHASVIQSLLALASGTPLRDSGAFRLPWGGYAVVTPDAPFRILETAVLPHPPMTPRLAQALLAAAAPGERVPAHCRAVAAKAAEVARALPVAVDENTLYCAALLHDLARPQPGHAETGAAWLQDLGYPDLAALVRQHHDPAEDASLEALILYICDKCVREDRPVSVEKRFADSLARCRGPEAVAAHGRRLETARQVREKINGLCGFEIVP